MNHHTVAAALERVASLASCSGATARGDATLFTPAERDRKFSGRPNCSCSLI
jgi:hypothetical protein